LLNTLYVTTHGAFVGREAESLKVRIERETRLQVPVHHLASVVCFGAITVSPDALALCAEKGVTVVFLTGSGRYVARLEGPLGRTATLRRAQYAVAADEARALVLARGFVAGKIANARTQLRRAGRTRESEVERLDRAAERLRVLGERTLTTATLDGLRGVEGEAAARYFDAFDAMLATDLFAFERRSRRPPENEVNAMLSFGYALLTADCLAAAEGAGLDPAVGFLHAERPGRPALALDLVEEFRVLFVDRLVLALVRLGQLKPADFNRLPTGEVRMSDAARRAFLSEYQKRKREAVQHPMAKEPGTWAYMPHVQARLLARAIRNELEYVPFLAK
jgi:CRISPR-associated protein Cas1